VMMVMPVPMILVMIYSDVKIPKLIVIRVISVLNTAVIVPVDVLPGQLIVMTLILAL